MKHLRATKVLLIIRSLWPSQPSHDTQPLNDLAQITMHNSHQTLFNGKKFPGKHHETKVTHKSIQKFEVPQVDMEANQWKWDFLGVFFSPPKSCQNWLVVSTHLKNTSQNGNFPQIGVFKKRYLKPPPRKIGLEYLPDHSWIIIGCPQASWAPRALNHSSSVRESTIHHPSV